MLLDLNLTIKILCPGFVERCNLLFLVGALSIVTLQMMIWLGISSIRGFHLLITSKRWMDELNYVPAGILYFCTGSRYKMYQENTYPNP